MPVLRMIAPELAFGTLRQCNTVLHGISLHTDKGECLAMVRESGSGKSSLANFIPGIYPPSGGTMHFMAQDLHPQRPDQP